MKALWRIGAKVFGHKGVLAFGHIGVCGHRRVSA